ncbi:hypothetical protein IJ707_05115, partial [bacterium]|nr:hypothetical protein [bacterium]
VNNIENKNINQLAIKLDKKNEYAYINVIYNYLNNNEFELALEIFNNNYAKEFNLDNIQNKKRLMWFTASKYLEYKRPFEAVNCQKMVIDTELISYEK